MLLGWLVPLSPVSLGLVVVHLPAYSHVGSVALVVASFVEYLVLFVVVVVVLEVARRKEMKRRILRNLSILRRSLISEIGRRRVMVVKELIVARYLMFVNHLVVVWIVMKKVRTATVVGVVGFVQV